MRFRSTLSLFAVACTIAACHSNQTSSPSGPSAPPVTAPSNGLGRPPLRLPGGPRLATRNPAVLRMLEHAAIPQTPPPGTDQMTAGALCRFTTYALCNHCYALHAHDHAPYASVDACTDERLALCAAADAGGPTLNTPPGFRAACILAIGAQDCATAGYALPPACDPNAHAGLPGEPSAAANVGDARR